MSNPFFRPYIPGFRVRPQDDVPGFNIDETDGLFPPAWGLDGTQTPPGIVPLTPGPTSLTGWPPSIGLAGIRAAPPNMPDFNLNESELPRQDTTWFDAMQPESESSKYPDTVQLPSLPGNADEQVQPTPPQIPAWLYNLMTMPLPSLSTAIDPRTGRPFVPNAPLVNPVRTYGTTDQNPDATAGGPADYSKVGSMLDLGSFEKPSVEHWTFPDMPEAPPDTNRRSGIPTGQAEGAQVRVPWNARMSSQPIEIPPTPSVRPAGDSNFILTNAGDADMQSGQQQSRLPQYLPTQLKMPASPPGP